MFLHQNHGAGGGLSTAILRPGGHKQSRCLVPDNNNTTIKQWTKGSGLKWGLYGRPFGPPLFTMFLSKRGEKMGW